VYLKFFCYLGALACAGLYFFTGENIELGIICSIVACIGYIGSIIFYQAYLPEIAHFDEREAISTRGFSYGYVGSTLLLIINIVVILYPQFFHLIDSTQAVRLSFLSVALWWAGFAQITFRVLPEENQREKISKEIVFKGYYELLTVWNQLKDFPRLKQFLFAFLFYIMSVQTVMYAATLFVIKEVHMKDEELIPTIFIIQVVAIVGAYVFSLLSVKIGSLKPLIISVVLWISVCVSAYFVSTAVQFMIVAFILGLGLGGIMVLSRSTFSKFLPVTGNNSTHQNFYDFIEKLAIVIGMFLFGYIEVLTGSMRASVLFFTLSLLIGLIMLIRLVKEDPFKVSI
jgi:UMF1 family MFS transporter